MNQTLIIDAAGNTLATLPGDLVQIKVGQPQFMLGQKNYQVLEIEVVADDRVVVVEPIND